MEYHFSHPLAQNRIFWIYFIIGLFFIIIGMTFIMAAPTPHMLALGIVWMLSNILLLIIVYHIYIAWRDRAHYTTLLLLNLLFLGMLILSVLWAGELTKAEGSTLQTMAGILIIIGGLFLAGSPTAEFNKNNNLIIGLVSLYLVIWLILTLYVLLG
jgi:hypothetical protein